MKPKPRHTWSGAPRTIVVVGASSGIGRCTAVLFAHRGWQVGLLARGKPGLQSVHEEITRSGARACFAVADVCNEIDIEAAADHVEIALGPIDAWINCAGNGVYGRFLDVPASEFNHVTNVTYLGTVNGTRVALRRMLPRNAGTVVNVCSAIAYHGMPLLTSYSGAKAAVRGFTDGMRAELAHDKSDVKVKIVFPPAVNTPFFSHATTYMRRAPRPARPVYQPDIVALAIFHATTTSKRGELRIGAITTLFDLGCRLVPNLVERAIAQLGYEGQETDCPQVAALHKSTLFIPSDRPSGAQGPFSAEARGLPGLDWLNHAPRSAIAGVGLCCAAMLWFLWLR